MINQGAEYDNFSGLVGEIGIMSSITDELRLGLTFIILIEQRLVIIKMNGCLLLCV